MSEEVNWKGLFDSEAFANEYDDLRLKRFRNRRLISKDKISDWKKAGLLYYSSSIIFLFALLYLAINLSSESLGVLDRLNYISAISIAALSALIGFFKRQEFYEEDVSRSDLIYHEFAKMVDIYYSKNEDYSKMQKIIEKIGVLSDLNALLGGRTLPRDIKKGLSVYRSYLRRASSNEKLDEFIEISFQEVMSHPINYLELSEEETYIEVVRSYKEETVVGRSLAKHISEPIDRFLDKFLDLGQYEILAIIIVALSLVANYFGKNVLTSAGLILTLVIYFARD